MYIHIYTRLYLYIYINSHKIQWISRAADVRDMGSARVISLLRPGAAQVLQTPRG